MTRINYRHNIMSIDSIQAFASIKGGFHNNIRDVYLIRALGEPQNVNQLIVELDKQMNMEMSNGKLKYKRISALPQIKDMTDTQYYSAMYTEFQEKRLHNLKRINLEEKAGEIVFEALNTITALYHDTKSNVSNSMIHNLGTKLLFWLDQTMGECLESWMENSNIKIIADNVLKEQEYLFYLFLTYIGCDVLLLQNRSDISIDGKLLKYSCKFDLGQFGNTIINEYRRYIPEEHIETVRHNIQPAAGNVRVVIPERADRRKSSNVRENTNIHPITRQTVPVQGQQPCPEKSFEELAQLASSVVLIAIHDRQGKIIGSGSGIMIGRNGYILTNNHVASGGYYYSVRIEDDEQVYKTNEVIKYNSVTDLAVIRIQRYLNPIPIYRGSKKLVRGQKVVAIGSPLGLFNSVSDGIISGFRRIDEVDMIQFTAPISHGSSGGAVLNMQGEIIGISTAGFDDGQNINLAVGYESILLFTNGFTN